MHRGDSRIALRMPQLDSRNQRSYHLSTRVVSSMEEQRTLNPLVAGSSPARPTNPEILGSLAQW